MKGSVAIVTGAGSGMGRALALKLAAAGARVALVGRTASKLASVEQEISTAGGEAASWALDVSDREAVHKMAQEVHTRFGRIDFLVNNAGHSSSNRLLLKTTSEEIESILASNLVGTIVCCQEIIPYMLQQRSGTVLNVSSRAGVRPSPLAGMIYSAAKAGVISVTQYLQEEYRNQNLRFGVFAPGEVDTPILEQRPVRPDDKARSTMITADVAADVMFSMLALPQSVTIPELHLMPTELRDTSRELQR